MIKIIHNLPQYCYSQTRLAILHQRYWEFFKAVGLKTKYGQLEKIFKDKDTLFVDEIILVRDNKVMKILKRA